MLVLTAPLRLFSITQLPEGREGFLNILHSTNVSVTLTRRPRDDAKPPEMLR